METELSVPLATQAGLSWKQVSHFLLGHGYAQYNTISLVGPWLPLSAHTPVPSSSPPPESQNPAPSLLPHSNLLKSLHQSVTVSRV